MANGSGGGGVAHFCAFDGLVENFDDLAASTGHINMPW
jgi:hypothetical protein